MIQLSKQPIAYFFVLIAVSVATGWFLIGKVKQTDKEIAENSVFSPFVYQKQTDSVDAIDASHWKTYRNEEYGFEVKYPKGWAAEEFRSAGFGSPVDCAKTPEKCKTFGLRVFSKTNSKKFAQLETYKINTLSDSRYSDEQGSAQGFEKNETLSDGRIMNKVNNAFPMLASCVTTATLSPFISLNGNNGYFFVTWYPYNNEAECQKEFFDQEFDEIVKSFRKM